MSIKFTQVSQSSVEDDLVLKIKVKEALHSMCADKNPSRSVLNSIFQYAAAYDCVDSNVGKIGFLLN